MSYARWGEDSDVYVYLDCEGFLLCCCGNRLGFRAYTTQEMIDHLKEHRSKGDCVPDYTFDELENDREENDEDIAAMNAGVGVDELIAERIRKETMEGK